VFGSLTAAYAVTVAGFCYSYFIVAEAAERSLKTFVPFYLFVALLISF